MNRRLMRLISQATKTSMHAVFTFQSQIQANSAVCVMYVYHSRGHNKLAYSNSLKGKKH